MHAAPPKVWTALTRFEDYERWSPFVRIAGPLELGALVQYSFRMKTNHPRFFTVDARIAALEPQKRVTFRFGLRGLISIEESYSVAPVPVGSQLVHSFRCTGLLSVLKPKKMRRNLSQILEITDRRLRQHLGQARPRSPASKRIRRGFRSND
ncbi:MAG: SRPBCC family protein [Sphingobium sp.]